MDNICNKFLRQEIFDIFNGKCAYCGINMEKHSFTIDHIVPKKRHVLDISMKGKDLKCNYLPCCMSCNCSKGSLQLEEWRTLLNNKLKVLNENSSNYRILKRFGQIIEAPGTIKFFFEVLHDN